MTVGALKKIEPLAEVYEFDTTKQYVIYVPTSIDVRAFCRGGNGLGIRAQVIAVDNPKSIVWAEDARSSQS